MIRQEFGHQYIRQINDVPVKDQNRIKTDFFCIVCNSIFVILLFIISLAVFNKESLIKMSLPNDAFGNICGYGDSNDFTILYYPEINDPTKRICVSQCPKIGDKKIDCFESESISCNSLLPVKSNTQFERTRLGLFCFPTNSQQKNILLENIGLDKRYHFMGVYDAMWRSFWISALIAIIFIVLVQFFPLKVIPFTILIGGAFSLIFGLVVMLMTTGNILIRLLFFFILAGLAAACGYTLINKDRMKQIFICARLIQVSTKVLRQNLLTIAYIPIFVLFFFCLLVLVGYQTLAAWSFSYFIFSDNYPFYSLQGFGSGFLQFLIAIQFLWGMTFLKQACNFCVSGVATQWYFYRKKNQGQIQIFRSIKNLVLYHWGSVLGCALLTFTCYIFDYIVGFLYDSDTPQRNNKKNEYDSLVEQKVYYNDRGIFDFLNLCRSQTMSYINIISVPYCNAARYCEQLSSSSSFYDYSQSTNRTYRLSAHIMIITLVTFISTITVKNYSGQSDIWGIIYIAVVSLFTITFFLGLHADLAQGLLISTFVEQAFVFDEINFNNNKKNLKNAISIPDQSMIKLYEDDVTNLSKYDQKSITYLLLEFNHQLE